MICERGRCCLNKSYDHIGRAPEHGGGGGYVGRLVTNDTVIQEERRAVVLPADGRFRLWAGHRLHSRRALKFAPALVKYHPISAQIMREDCTPCLTVGVLKWVKIQPHEIR